MKIYKVSWNNFFYWIILLSLQVESFMIKKCTQNEKKYIKIIHNITKANTIGRNNAFYLFVLLSFQTKSFKIRNIHKNEYKCIKISPLVLYLSFILFLSHLCT
jgi:hypothetical protein